MQSAFYGNAALANPGLNLDFTLVMDIGQDAFKNCAADLCIPERHFTADWEGAGLDACSGSLSGQPINVVLVIDKSPSTRCDGLFWKDGLNRKEQCDRRGGCQICSSIRAAFDALMLRVDLSTGSQVSIVSYSASASIHLLGSNNHSEISDTLTQSSPLWNTERGTDYMSGLSNAKLALDNENISNILPKVIIFYTDGEPLDRDRATAMANRLKWMGVSICAVGSGAADYDTLSEMASEGQSYYGETIQYITQLRSFCNLWPAPVPKLKTAVVIAGSIDQFERRRLSSVQDGLRSKIAQATNVASEAVELQITPGSVRLEFTVTFESNASAFAGRNVLMDRMATPELAGQLLSSDAMEVTVETIEIYPNLFVDSYSEPPLLPPPPPPPSLPLQQPPPPSAPWPYSTATLPPIYIVMVVLGSLSAVLTAAVGIDFIGRFRVKSKIYVEGDGKGRSTFPRNTHCCGLCFILSLLSTSILLGVGLNPPPTPPPPIPLPLPAGVTSQYACAPACDNENLAASMVYARQIGDNAIAGFDALPAAEKATLLEPAFAAADEASRRLAYVRIFEALLPGGESLKQLGSDLEDADFTLTSLQSTTAILLQCISIDRAAGKNDRRTCTNTCEFTWSNQTFNQSNNGVCEDGGDQWWHTDPTISHDCLRGSDCNDCGWLGAITMEWRTAPFWGGAFTGGAASLIAKPNVTDTLEACPRSSG